MSENESKKLINDLRVVDLRIELEKRELDKNGNKAVLIERLQNALKEEGHDPETYTFACASDGKRTPGKGKIEDEKTEEDDEVNSTEQDKETPVKSKAVQNNEKITEDTKVKEDKPEIDCVKNEEEEESATNETTEEEQKNNSLSVKDCADSKEESETKPQENTAENDSQSEAKSEETSKPVQSSPSSNKKTPVKAPLNLDKTATEANGLIDNEDSINLTIGEDEANMVADEEDCSQEKDHKDESHGSSGQRKSVGEKSQDKTNQEKSDGKSGDKSSKDDKGKKTSSSGSSKNLWVSGLSTTTRATDLKQVFSKYGKVIGAKVVTNARTPGTRCFGFVSMASPEDANKAVQYLHKSELHGRQICVDKAKADSTGPPKRVESSRNDSPVKKAEEKKKEPVIRIVEHKKEETLVPPGTEGDIKEPEAPGTEKSLLETKSEQKDDGHKSRDRTKSGERSEKRPRSANSSHRSRGGSPVLTFDKIKEERERQRLRERERMLREEERRRETERVRQREIDRKQKEEFDRLDREKKKLKMERERLLREKDELLKLKSERQRLERERQKLEREKLEKEKEELERLKRQNMRLEEEARRKRSLSASREYESRKRPATDSRYVTHHTSSQSRYVEPSRSSEYKKESSHKTSSRELTGLQRRSAYEPETRRLVTSVTNTSRDAWLTKDRESARYDRSTVNSNNFREESLTSRSKPTESRHVRERYAEVPKSERFVERGDAWHGSGSTGGSGMLKTFNTREAWTTSDRKQDISEPWRSSTNSSRWPGNNSSMGIGSRSGPPGNMSNAMFVSSNTQGIPNLNLGLSMGSFSGGGERFDAYKQPYFKGP